MIGYRTRFIHPAPLSDPIIGKELLIFMQLTETHRWFTHTPPQVCEDAHSDRTYVWSSILDLDTDACGVKSSKAEA